MKPLYLKALMVAACSMVSVSEAKTYDLAEERNLKSWLEENNLLVETQFRYLELPFEVDYNSEVAYYIERYLRPGRRETERMLGKTAYYFPIFEKALTRYNLPQWLKYLPIVESGLQAGVESPVGAVGLWQFMPATAAFFDLRVEDRVDERRDPYRSSEAAAQLLSYLYERFGDWSLTLAAYNCGPAKVKRAIRREGKAGYEAIKKRLPLQTQRYITKLKAAAYVANYYYFFGLEARPDSLLNTDVATLSIEKSMSVQEVARRAGVSEQVVQILNPAFIDGTIIAEEGSVPLRLPKVAAAHWNASGENSLNASGSEQESAATGQAEDDNEKIPYRQENRKPVKANHSRLHLPAVTGIPPLPERLPEGEQSKKTVLLLLQRQELRHN